jgi:hypothetical protein
LKTLPLLGELENALVSNDFQESDVGISSNSLAGSGSSTVPEIECGEETPKEASGKCRPTDIRYHLFSSYNASDN